jgi:hypothetical protein
MACIDPRDIPLHLLPPGQSRVEQHNALGGLKPYSFITVQPINQFLNLHQLVHLTTRNWLRRGNSLEQWIAKTGTRLKSIFPNDDYRNRTLRREYLPHAQSFLRSKEFHSRGGTKEWNCSTRLGHVFIAMGDIMKQNRCSLKYWRITRRYEDRIIQ